jgi:hypothetical protein
MPNRLRTQSYTTKKLIFCCCIRLKLTGAYTYKVYSKLSYAIHGEVTSSSPTGIRTRHCLSRRIKCPLDLPYWHQTRALDRILLHWPLSTSSTYIIRNWNNPSISSQSRSHLVIINTLHISALENCQYSRRCNGRLAYLGKQCIQFHAAEWTYWFLNPFIWNCGSGLKWFCNWSVKGTASNFVQI